MYDIYSMDELNEFLRRFSLQEFTYNYLKQWSSRCAPVYMKIILLSTEKIVNKKCFLK